MSRYDGKNVVITGGSDTSSPAAIAVLAGRIEAGKSDKEAPDKAARLRAEFTESSPMKRWGHPSEFAPAVAFLAFDATYVAGIELAIDGGESQL